MDEKVFFRFYVNVYKMKGIVPIINLCLRSFRMSVSQREIVYTTVTAVFAQNKVVFTPSQSVAKDLCTSDLRKAVTLDIMAAFKAGQVEFKATEANAKKVASEPELRKYISGLITNWFNKDPRLNGGVGGSSASTGTKSSGGRMSSDPEIKRLRNLHKTLVAAGKSLEASTVEAEIVGRLTAVKASKAVKTA